MILTISAYLPVVKSFFFITDSPGEAGYQVDADFRYTYIVGARTGEHQ